MITLQRKTIDVDNRTTEDRSSSCLFAKIKMRLQSFESDCIGTSVQPNTNLRMIGKYETYFFHIVQL